MFPKCVEGKCCPKGSREGAGDSDIDGIDALFGPPYLIDGKCVENTCEMQMGWLVRRPPAVVKKLQRRARLC